MDSVKVGGVFVWKDVQRIYSLVYSNQKHSSLNFNDDHFSQASIKKIVFNY